MHPQGEKPAATVMDKQDSCPSHQANSSEVPVCSFLLFLPHPTISKGHILKETCPEKTIFPRLSPEVAFSKTLIRIFKEEQIHPCLQGGL